MRNVLTFDFEVVMDGRNLPRPVNYWMARIAPPEDEMAAPVLPSPGQRLN